MQDLIKPEYLHFILQLLTAILCGALVGIERQWINRVAGIQTNVLVSAGACTFILSSYFVGYEGQSASRIAAQIVSGIGFLGAGMIFRDGFNTHGINTAATIWCSAAIGILAGMNLLSYAFIVTFILIISNILFRQLDHLINDNRKWIDTRLKKEFEVQVIAPKDNLNEIRTKIIKAINTGDHIIFSVKTNFEKQELVKIRVCFSTMDKNHEKVQLACENIETINPTLIVDWSEIQN